MITDPISDMLTRIRNGLRGRKKEVAVPYSRIKEQIAQILEKNNLVAKVEKSKDNFGALVISLAYDQEGKPGVTKLRRISKPGCRVYVKKEKIPHFKGDWGMVIISTPQGLMTGKEAHRRKLGGELICEIS